MPDETKKPEEGSKEELRELLKENLWQSKEIHRLVRKMRHYIWWQTFMGVVWFVLIVGVR